ncbi:MULTISPECIES: gliding motility-associated ABC transporter substrate-binding protein GldG [Myroides]|uniref:Gliding motility-associated ABC transporter substrate-binding protein GldG n=1 Tax=Myroides albus TaxID=2562892 RepID=A0A6I3LMK8_9FLAO|nr:MULTISPECIES: gliding motility-associated ABC transporter substrate-binding protein GldG [Myroides]MTG97821.1 gliding motility-associated ABC transporter substrate-binding protein GldG [Myroides albus]MVX37235.1 gliding motility-associated ABC transporter substrate-binding protein GldG [Myroides sp. LoEW2-1]UVD79778.1 gliding motility-associated ABC transporter substrate-binding protein GldG [Myroides albus]
MKSNLSKNLKVLLQCIVVIVLLNLIGGLVYKRFDLTQDKRYTLSEATVKLLEQVENPIIIDVFLEGKFPGEFRRLQLETRQLLEEFELVNSNVKFQFVNPLDEANGSEEVLNELVQYGIKPVSITVNDKGTQTQQVVLPWAIVSRGEKASKVQLLKNMLGANTEEKVLTSVQHLEYAFIDAIQKVIKEKQKKIAVLRGNDELEDVYIADLLLSLKESYYIAPFTLDSVASNPVKTLNELKEYDLTLIAKPHKNFTDKQIQVVDQYIVSGGKAIFMLDQVQADFDSLRATGNMLAYAKDQSLGEMLFKYGVRINPVLVKDEIGAPIKLAIGKQGSETQYGDFIWKFSPFVYPEGKHPIIKNIEGVKFDFVSPIDTLKNNIAKTVLLQSSKYSSTVGTPIEISLDVLNEQVGPEVYEGKGNYILGVLLEGDFRSVFQNRVLPFQMSDFKEKGLQNKIIVFSDGNLAKNQLDQRGAPMELGYDKWTNKLYGNKELLMNSVDFLLDDSGLIQLRTKEVRFPMMDKVKVYQNYTKIQMLALILPILIVVIFSIVFLVLKKRIFEKK